jgi:hypothetical protein
MTISSCFVCIVSIFLVSSHVAFTQENNLSKSIHLVKAKKKKKAQEPVNQQQPLAQPPTLYYLYYYNPFYHDPESLAATPAQTMESQKNDLSIIKRVMESYRRAAENNENRGDSMWQMFFDQRHVPLHKIFMEGMFDEVAMILRYPARSDLFYGFDNLVASLVPSFADPSSQQAHAKICLDCLVRLAESIGAISLDNPEAYQGVPMHLWQADAVVDKINQALNKQIIFPNPYPDEYGLLTSYGIVSYRAIQAFYQAYRIKQLLDGIENPRVLEIGAGLGRTAYYAKLLGIDNYTIVDLPFTALSSGYFLGCTLGDDQILYSGENALDAERRIKMLTPAKFLASTDTYDLIINADGFTEMDPKVARAYWKQIEHSTSIFLSINHEINPYQVKTLIDESQCVAKVERYPYWMRQGYVEEIVRFK